MKAKNYKKKFAVPQTTETDHIFDPTKKKIDFRFDKEALNMLIGYAFSRDNTITKINLNSLKKLMDLTNMRIYETDSSMYTRISIIKSALDGRLREGLEKTEVLKSYCRKENDEDCEEILKNVENYMNLSKSELKHITNAILDRLQFAFIIWHKDIIMNEFLRIDQGEYSSLREVCKDVKERIYGLMNDIRKVENSNTLDTFSLEPEIFETFIEETVKHASDPNNALVTGIRMLNDMLSPGVMGGRLYVVLACTGVFKSSFLLLMAYWIKKYNRVTPRRRDPGCIPAVVLFIAENNIEETIIRLFNCSVTNEDITKFTPEEVVQMMREKGELTLKNGETNLIIKYFANNELSPNMIYGVIEDIEDQNQEVIAIIIDYIKRMRSDIPAPDERVKYRDISNGLKDLAIRLNVPVITAQQINRSGNMTIDAALQGGKEDLGRFLGRGNIAESWDILENSDWACILNVEIERSTGKRYLTIKEIKKRYKSYTDITYFNHPFEEGSTIKLIEDVNMEKSVSKISIASDLTSADMIKGNRINAKKDSEPFFGFGLDDAEIS